MMKKAAILAGLCTGIVFVVSLAIAGDAKDNIPLDKIKDKMAPVTLSHAKHSTDFKIECASCHHTNKKGETPKACTECHKKDKTEGKALTLKEAYHKQCIDCHKKEAAGGKKAPTKCMECHKK